MTRYVAFLRAINVGGHTVTMPGLRSLVEEAGYADVETFIASGNVILNSDQQAGQIEATLEAAFESGLGYAVDTFVRTTDELATVAAADPFGPVADGHKVQVGFLDEAPGTGVRQAVAALSNDYDEIVVDGREVYWLTRGSISGSKVKPSAFAKALGSPTTMRNVTTLRRLVAKYGSD